ncbi:hypothetical protein, partial [Mesorhizobium escarrei]|uniref:hypothetical protein n=1 Tax=Mesorhizobium escarrei TaxID=666018 RepID=UPI0020A6E685
PPVLPRLHVVCKNRTRKFCFSSFFVPTTEPPTALFGRSSADDIDRSIADVRRDIREPHFVRRGVQFAEPSVT